MNPVNKLLMKLTIFDKEFEVEVLSIEDKSKKGFPDRTVTFEVKGETYIYVYTGTPMAALSRVMKIREGSKPEEVYSAWRHIPNGSYYEEIGRRLSISQKENR